MPHQCTNCGRTFEDGSTEMLSGCPDCGGNKFQFQPAGSDAGSDATGDAPSPSTEETDSPADGTATPSTDPADPPERPGDTVSRTVGSAAATVRDLVGGGSGSTGTDRPSEESANGPVSDSPTESRDPDVGADAPSSGENAAQADARSAVVESDDLPQTTTETGASDATPDEGVDRAVVDTPDAERTDRPDLAELREELNDQFESIRVLAPGQYELNLMELYDREEYIIALQEDGRYSIRVPETIGDVDA